MHYSLFAGGKRIRPILHLAAAEAVGGDSDACLPFACALELIHTYSLIHDDLPAMDDDDLRRGKATNHVVFGEAMAILAGDALLTEAFRLLSSPSTLERLDPRALLRAIHELAHAAGSQGMVGGQALDILSENRPPEEEVLHFIHSHKTGALIRASVRTGAILARASEDVLERLTRYGERLGLAFQIRDDLLNVEGDPRKLGKSVGTDASKGKMTYPALFGLERTRTRLGQLVEEALDALSPLDKKADPLRWIASYMIERDR
jgi:geranylgeranyl diphosphate synthase type II